MHPEEPAAKPRLVLGFVRLTAVAYAAIGLWIMLAASPKVPYAEPWRYLASFLKTPFPANALAADNGRREVLPNLVRIADLHWFGANQWLQIGVGVGLAGLALLLFVVALQKAPAAARTAAVTIVCIGMFWLGNSRQLAHGNESVGLFLVQCCLLLGLLSLTRPGSGRTAAWVASALAVVATLTVSAGFACFLAFGLVLWLQRAPRTQWLPLAWTAALAVIAVLVDLMLLGTGGAVLANVTAPLDHLDQLLRWLGAPFVWAFDPLLDVDHAARLPTALLSVPCSAIARPLQAAFGPALAARWPAMAFGALGVAELLASTWRLRREPEASAWRRLGIGVAWFGFGVGAIMVAARFHYYELHPEQLTTARNVPWSMLLWTGLALGFVLQPGRRARTGLVFAAAIGLLFAPSQVWTGRNAWKLQRTADLTALGAAVGALDRDFPLEETYRADLVAAVPLLRDAHQAMFTWPETAVLGSQPAAARTTSVAVHDLVAQKAPNVFDGPCTDVEFLCAAPPAGRMVLLDANGTACGLAIACGPGAACRGWVHADVTAAQLRVVALH